MEEIAAATVTELRRRLSRGELSPLELMEATLTVVEARNPLLNALVHLDAEEGLERARAASHAPPDAVGALHGIPTAIKDLFDPHPGWPTTWGGLPALRNHVVDARCPFGARVEAAGAIVLGKTNAPVLGFRGTCDNPLFGPTSNPFDLQRNSGGSSGGSAAAVAGGLLPFAEGTDGGGSIRIPAAWCGIVGFKPSYGRIPFVGRPNAFASTSPFVFEGPLTRTVEDAALVLSVLCGPDSRDPLCLPDDGFDPLAAIGRGVAGMRIAYSPALDVYPVDGRVAAVAEEAVRGFEAAGARVEPVELGIRLDQRQLSDLWCRLIMPLNLQALQQLERDGIDLLGDHADQLPAQIVALIERHREMTVLAHFEDQALRTQVFDCVRECLDDFDLLVTPTLACLPVENAADGNTVGPSEIEGVAVDELIGWCLTYLFNFTGHPACSVPAGLAEGLPVGLQLIGRPHRDGDVLAAAAAIELVRPWAPELARVGRQLGESRPGKTG